MCVCFYISWYVMCCCSSSCIDNVHKPSLSLQHRKSRNVKCMRCEWSKYLYLRFHSNWWFFYLDKKFYTLYFYLRWRIHQSIHWINWRCISDHRNVTDLFWDSSSHKLIISMRHINYMDGLLKWLSWIWGNCCILCVLNSVTVTAFDNNYTNWWFKTFIKVNYCEFDNFVSPLCIIFYNFLTLYLFREFCLFLF